MPPASNKTKILENERNTPIDKLPDEIIKNCLTFVGDGNFSFLALVSRRFHDCYVELYPNRETWPTGSASDSLQCAKLCFSKKDARMISNLFRSASMKGQSDIMEFAIENDLVSTNVFRKHDGGWFDPKYEIGLHLNALKLVHQHSFDISWTGCYNAAIEAERIDVLEWVIDEGLHLQDDNLYFGFAGDALGHNKLHILKWAVEVKGLELEPDVMTHAACMGNIEAVKWLHERSVPWDEGTCRAALYFQPNPIIANEIIDYLKKNTFQR